MPDEVSRAEIAFNDRSWIGKWAERALNAGLLMQLVKFATQPIGEDDANRQEWPEPDLVVHLMDATQGGALVATVESAQFVYRLLHEGMHGGAYDGTNEPFQSFTDLRDNALIHVAALAHELVNDAVTGQAIEPSWYWGSQVDDTARAHLSRIPNVNLSTTVGAAYYADDREPAPASYEDVIGVGFGGTYWMDAPGAPGPEATISDVVAGLERGAEAVDAWIADEGAGATAFIPVSYVFGPTHYFFVELADSPSAMRFR